MPNEVSRPIDKAELTWQRVQSQLSQHAVPDPRFHDDYSRFIPDFRDSWTAANRVMDLPCYKESGTILFTPDNSTEQLRCRALRDGKKLLVATYQLNKGFVILDPQRIPGDQFQLASCVQGGIGPGVGRNATLAQLQDEGVKIDLMIMGSLAVSTQGVQLRRGNGISRLAWLILVDREILATNTPVIAVVHDCQVVPLEKDVPDDEKTDITDVQCDFVVTAEQVINVEGAGKPDPTSSWLEDVSECLLFTTPPLQELNGVKLMEKIMGKSSPTRETGNVEPDMPPSHARMGIDMVEKLMKGYKA